MVDFKTLAIKLAETTVDIGAEKPVKIRALRTTEVARILAVFPRPEPKTKIPDLNRGSLAPPIPDENEPGHAGKINAWYRMIEAAQVAVAMELVPDGQGGFKDAKDDSAWLTAAVREVTENLTPTQLRKAHAALLALLNPGQVQRALIEEVPGEPTADDIGNRFKLPDRYRVSSLGVALRICREWHIDPFVAFDANRDDPTMWAALESQLQITMEEERSRLAPSDAGGLGEDGHC